MGSIGAVGPTGSMGGIGANAGAESIGSIGATGATAGMGATGATRGMGRTGTTVGADGGVGGGSCENAGTAAARDMDAITTILYIRVIFNFPYNFFLSF